MNRWIILSIITFVLGLGLGFSLTSYSSSGGIVGIAVSGIGVGIGVLNFLKAWSKEINLEFGIITQDNNQRYFIRVHQKGGKVRGRARNANGHLTLENTSYEYAPTVWADGQRRIVDIDEHQDLFLFDYPKGAPTIILPSAYQEIGYFGNYYEYKEVSKKLFRIQVAFENGSPPKDYVRRLEDIVATVNTQKDPNLSPKP